MSVFLNVQNLENGCVCYTQESGRVMTPREQLRKISALGEQGALDEKHWYRLVNGMSAGGERSSRKCS